VTRGQLLQRAGLLGLNGGGAAAAVPPTSLEKQKSKKYTFLDFEKDVKT